MAQQHITSGGAAATAFSTSEGALPISEHGLTILEKRYLRRGSDGRPMETAQEMFRRVARTVAAPEALYGGDAQATEEAFYHLMTSLRFLPNSPTFTGAGTPLGQLSACFVLPIKDDMGKEPGGIFQTLRDAALIQQTGGGVGFSFSRLRPKGDLVASSGGIATGPVGFLKAYDMAFGVIAQGGVRRGACMAVLSVDHPDIEEFIRCKTQEGAITNFNISVGITDQFMRAVQEDADFNLVNPRDGRLWKTVRARELFHQIAQQAHHNGEPGVLFLDTANRANPLPHLYELEATNPCITGETLIYTDEGLQRADELATLGKPVRVVTDGRLGTDVLMPASPVFATGIREVYRLTTSEGYEVRLTADHRVMTSRGWVAASELQPGDRVHILNRRGGFGPSGSLDEGRVLGWLVGDGTVYGLSENKLQVPTAVFAGSQDMQRGFLQALFTADGQVVNDGEEKGCSVRLSSSHLPLLKDVQRLLLNFGIASRIYEQRRAGGYRFMPDGRGGKKEYFHQPQHDLVISETNLIRFANDIGFLTEAKQNRLANYLGRMTRGPYDESYLVTVEAVEPDGREQVYDLQQPETCSFVANGLVVHNCGEQFLGEYENCCLGSINLARHMTDDDRVDWEKLRQSVELSTRFLDNVIDANGYVPAVPQLRQAALKSRRIGLGIMGLADMMYRLGIRYGSEEAQEFAGQVMEFIRYHSMKASIALAGARGPFPAIKGSIYDPDNLRWQPPQPQFPFRRDWQRPALDWDEISAGIRRHGIRNAALTTVAPTGTVGTVAGCEGYGCEPVFALAYMRTVKDNDHDLKLTYTSPLFEKALGEAGLDEAARTGILEQVSITGSCQAIAAVPEAIRHVFVVAQDITPEEHVRMQAALQSFVDSSISKTINCPAQATVEDVEAAYMLAWELGCKGLTVYVTGSRRAVVLETRETTQARGSQQPLATSLAARKPRPNVLRGYTYRKATPIGTAYLNINENGVGQPFEVFLNVGKAGSDTAAVSEALGRLVSLILRLPSTLTPQARLRQIIDQLAGIGGGRPLGFGANRVRSLPDAVAQVLAEYLGEVASNGDGLQAEQMALPIDTQEIGDLCPECGQATFIAIEGCRKCSVCGFSEC